MKNLFSFAIVLAMALVSRAQTIGIQLYSLRDQFPKDVPGTLALIKSWGITEIEGEGTFGLSQEDFNKLLFQNGLKVVSVGVEFDDLDKDIDKVIKKANAFGAKMVMCAFVPHVGDSFTRAHADEAIKVFNASGEKLAREGLSLCYHAHDREFASYEEGSMFDYMAGKMNPKFANFEMDVCLVKESGTDPLKFFNKYSSRIKMIHFNVKDRKHGTLDSNAGHADAETNLVLGNGDVGIAEVIKAARKAGVKYYFIEDESSRVLQQVPQTLAFLKPLLSD
jgi:sugar phosphate isomerase/epimerase